MPTQILSIKNWSKYQTVTKVNPIWIKLHTCLLNDYKFSELDDIIKGHFLLLLVLAGRHANKIPYDKKYIAAEIHAKTQINFEALELNGFIEITEEDIYIYNNNIYIEKEKEINSDLSETVKLIVLDLNQKAGKDYRCNSKETIKLISSLLKGKGGYTVDDFKHVNTVKANEWLNTDYEQYLRPKTLYSNSNFEAYRNQKVTKKRDRFTY